MSKVNIKDQNTDHKYFSILQKILSHIGLTAFERSVYWAIKDCAGEYGSCTKSYAKLAEMAGLSIPSLKRTLLTLSEKNKFLKKPLISIKNRLTEYGDRDTNEIVLLDLWNENIKFFQKEIGEVTQNLPQVTQTPGVRSHRPEGQVTQSYNKESLIKNPLEEQQQAAAVFFDCLVKDTRLTDDNRLALMRFSQDRIRLAQEYSHKVKPNIGLIQQLMWHCGLKNPPDMPKKSFWDSVRDHFKNEKIYNGALCYINSEGIAFERGITNLSAKFSDPTGREKFEAALKQFGIKWSFQ